MKASKLMNTGMDYAQDAFEMAKDHMPSSHHLAKKKMMMDAKLAKGVTKAMPAKVKHMELAKMIALPLAGALVALLFAPKSGKELRTDIKSKFVDVKDTGMEKGKELREAGMEKTQELKGKYSADEETSYDPSDNYDESVEAHGNVHGTAAEPKGDETIPADKLDETLDDLGYSSEDELLNEDK
ncbi:YtxH domain-containing protein [Desemzia incerta]|uniref:YtxH domain-containing protein n=1 Tax=Desemzia incerta TaxID=82801 RepID=UPI0024C24819|nr:YtxH domain-containing protein [Desemzia incerta]WHZ33033.1 YtxH domain-containing protein [Desemzia incerta]